MNTRISTILTVLVVFLISCITHFPFINYPKQFTEPEIQYLSQIENYFSHTDFKLDQPPLSNFFYSLIVYLQYDNIFPMSHKIQFNVLLRIIPALFSSLVPPIIALILILYDVPISASFLCSAVLAFEPCWSSLNRLFNPNSFFYFFSILSILISKISEMNISNSSRYFTLKQIESVLFAIAACSDSSGIAILIALAFQHSKNSQNKAGTDIKSKILSFLKSFQYHFIYSAVLFIVSISIHIYLVSSPSNTKPIYSQFFSLIFNILISAKLSEIFTIQKLKSINISNHIKILNNPAILILIFIGVFISMFYSEFTFSISAFVSFFLSFRYEEELIWRTPLFIILCLLSLGLAIKNLSHIIARIILISAFCLSLAFYAIFFSNSYGGRIVL